MITQNIQSMNPVIESKREVPNISCPEKGIVVWVESPCFRRTKKVVEVLDNGIFGNKVVFIPHEGTVKCVGVGKESDEEDQKVMEDGSIETTSLRKNPGFYLSTFFSEFWPGGMSLVSFQNLAYF